jgi:hypothetical protein
MSSEKIKIIMIEILANSPRNRHKDTLNYYRAGHNNG